MSSTPPRRFKVEPVETTVKSSKTPPVPPTGSPTPRRKFVPEPIETTAKTHRKPVEATVASSRGTDAMQTMGRFKPEPVETTVKSSRDKFAKEWASQTSPTRTRNPDGKTSSSTSKQAGKRPVRKFAPLLIETAKRSRRVSDSAPAVQSPIETIPSAPDNTPTIDSYQNPLFLEIKRATSPLAMRRPNSLSSMRSHHSFKVPDLEPIESSESEGSTPPSPSTSPSVTSDYSYMYTEATRMRESVDERFSGYLLDLAAKAAEKQLHEQAMAAFPNDDHHERVDHFIDHESEESGSRSEEPESHEARIRRESSAVNWELVAMQQHREKLEQQQERERDRKKKREAEMNRVDSPKYSPWGTAAGGWQKDGELDRMRKGARPPMLGGDIQFPRCPSPEPARFDPTQGCDAVRIAMCYLTEQSQQAEKGEGLWCGSNSNSKQPSSRPSLYSRANSNANSRSPSPGGLWGGFCVNSGQTPPRGPTGLLTPSVEIGNPFSPCPTPAMSLFPPTPPASHTDFASIDVKLAAEVAIDDEFGDNFVTQVYNYLSLGYPSLAQTFDEELSKISHIPITDLRQDDHLETTKGYIRLGEDGNLKDVDITEESCMRWQALRIYIREWAKQQPGFTADGTAGGAGVAVRKGSWAL